MLNQMKLSLLVPRHEQLCGLSEVPLQAVSPSTPPVTVDPLPVDAPGF